MNERTSIVNTAASSILRLLCLMVLVQPPAFAQNWARVTAIPSSDITSLFVRGDTVLVGTDSAVYASNDRGLTWKRSSTLPTTPAFVDAVILHGGKTWAGTGGVGVLVSTDHGQIWQPSNNGFAGLGSNYISGFIERNGILYAATQGAGVFQLQNDIWSEFGNLSGVSAGNVEFFGLKGDTLVAGAGGNGYVWFAPQGTATWDGVLLAPFQGDAFIVYSVLRFKELLYAGSTYGVHRSTDHGASWEYCGTGIPNSRRVRLVVREDTIYAIANGANAQWYKSASGDNWTFIESTIFTYDECVLGTTIFSARGDGLWVSAVPTSVPQPSPVPSRFTLGQNYPNPFNPATTISFGLPVRSHVTLTVYDVMGREVTALVDEELAPGTYTRQWTAARMAGGVYFYRLQTPVFTETKRLVLLR